MNKNKYYRTRITVDVLSEEVLGDMSLSDIEEYCTTGAGIGGAIRHKVKVLTGRQMAKELYTFGSDPGFFMLNDDGTEADS